jgi:hypothetical protein
MSDVMAVIAVMWARRCGGSARYGTYAPADRRTDAGTTPAARDCADDGSGSGPEQTAAYRAIGGIVGVRGGRGRQQQLAIVDGFLILSFAQLAMLESEQKSAGSLGEPSRFRPTAH